MVEQSSAVGSPTKRLAILRTDSRGGIVASAATAERSRMGPVIEVDRAPLGGQGRAGHADRDIR